MAGSKHGRGADQVSLRLPDGLRGRIKAYADSQGRSMNAEIVRILEREFPEPEGIHARIDEILSLVGVLKTGVTEENLDKLSWKLLKTIRQIADGTIQGVGEEASEAVHQQLEHWEEKYSEAENDRALELLDEGEVDSLTRGRGTAKYVDVGGDLDDEDDK